MRVFTAVTIALCATLFTSGALACGDSLHRVGKGVSYRTYTAPLPGNLLVYGNSAATKQLAEELARSGHDVRLVGSPEEISAALVDGDYDIVIAPFVDRAALGSSTDISFLPIAADGDEEKLARQAYGRAMIAEKHEIKHYLKAIHLTLKNSA